MICGLIFLTLSYGSGPLRLYAYACDSDQRPCLKCTTPGAQKHECDDCHAYIRDSTSMAIVCHPSITPTFSSSIPKLSNSSTHSLVPCFWEQFWNAPSCSFTKPRKPSGVAPPYRPADRQLKMCVELSGCVRSVKVWEQRRQVLCCEGDHVHACWSAAGALRHHAESQCTRMSDA